MFLFKLSQNFDNSKSSTELLQNFLPLKNGHSLKLTLRTFAKLSTTGKMYAACCSTAPLKTFAQLVKILSAGVAQLISKWPTENFGIRPSYNMALLKLKLA